MPADADLKTFVDQWVDDVSEAEGRCTNLSAKCSSCMDYRWGSCDVFSFCTCALHLRLAKFESQKELADLINQSSSGMGDIRQQMISVDLMDPQAPDFIRRLLHRAAAFVAGYKKHTKTAVNLLLGQSLLPPMFVCVSRM